MKVSELIQILARELQDAGEDMDVQFFMFAGDFGDKADPTGMPIQMEFGGYILSKPHRGVMDFQLRFDKASMTEAQLLCAMDFGTRYNDCS